MVNLTGDTHREFSRIESFCCELATNDDDILIILGDACINYYGDERDIYLKKRLARLPITLFCIHGNHERRPYTIPTYEETLWHEGIVYSEPDYPSLLFAKDGEIYNFDGRRCIAIGGAYSIDKHYRLARGWHWWEEEQPSDEIKARVEKRLAQENWQVDIVLSHTCPLKYEPQEVFIRGINQDLVDKSTEEWLDTIEEKLTYSAWCCAHYHTTKTVEQIRFLFKDICPLDYFAPQFL